VDFEESMLSESPFLLSARAMPTSLPPTVREHFGEDVADDFARWLDETFQQRAVQRDEYREVLSRLDVLEEGLNHVDKRFDLLTEHVDDRIDHLTEHVDERIDHVEEKFEARLTGMEERFEERFQQIDQRFDQVGQRFEQVDRRFEQVDQRFEQVDQRFESMDAKLDRMNDRILSMTRWLIGLVALFGSLVTALLAVAQFG